MSPSLLAHLQSLARQTRRYVDSDNRERGGHYSGRMTHVADFYRPVELMRVCKWTRPS